VSPGRRRYVAAGVVAILLLGALAYLVTSRSRAPSPDGQGVQTPSICGNASSSLAPTATGECIGIIERSDLLHQSIQAVAEKILQMNATVARSSDPYVKVVLLTPLSVSRTSDSAMSIEQVRYSLEGAFTALHRVNTASEFGDSAAAKIQLLLANFGSHQEFSRHLVDEIVRQSTRDNPVVAVVGLGSSFAGTERMVIELAKHQIPMVSAVASSNSLNGQIMTGLYSVSPSNTDYVLALKALLDDPRSNVKLTNGIVVADSNEHDAYVRTLRESYITGLESYLKFDYLQFVGGTVNSPITSRVFDPVVTNLCNAVNDRVHPLQMVFFAGRVADFRGFAEVLKTRTCKAAPLTVLVGATGFHAARNYVDILDEGNVTVIYSSSADAPRWIQGGTERPEGFATFLDSFRKNGFTDESLSDGYAIMYHDAVASAARAIRVAAQGVAVPRPADVMVQFRNLSLAYVVRGASGTLSFAGRLDGRAKGKVIVYRQLGLKSAVRLSPDFPPYYTR
jgi:hypothetical protein